MNAKQNVKGYEEKRTGESRETGANVQLISIFLTSARDLKSHGIQFALLRSVEDLIMTQSLEQSAWT